MYAPEKGQTALRKTTTTDKTDGGGSSCARAGALRQTQYAVYLRRGRMPAKALGRIHERRKRARRLIAR